MSLVVSDESQALLEPEQLVFDSSNWTSPVNVTLTPSPAHLLSPSASPINVTAVLQMPNKLPRRLSFKVADCMGDSLAYPFFVPGLPIALRGSTLARKPLQAAVCTNVTRDTGLAPSAVYLFRPQRDVEVALSTCRTAQLVVRYGLMPPAAALLVHNTCYQNVIAQGGFDTKLVVYQDVDHLGFDLATASPLLCSDAPCMAGSSLRVAMQAEISYAIVLTGFAGKAGSYQLDIKASNGSTVQGLTPSTGGSNSTAVSPVVVSEPATAALPFVVWGTGVWGACSAVCGPGTQARTVVCVQGTKQPS